MSWELHDEFVNYIESLGLKNFKPYELLIHTTRSKNNPPPKRLWKNIVSTIIVLDHLREFFDKPIVINSAYRSPSYNNSLGGTAQRSQHIAFNAIDFAIRGVTPIEAATFLKTWRKEDKVFTSRVKIERSEVTVNGKKIPSKKLKTSEDNGKYAFVFNGGVNDYRTFTHVDTRGINASW